MFPVLEDRQATATATSTMMRVQSLSSMVPCPCLVSRIQTFSSPCLPFARCSKNGFLSTARVRGPVRSFVISSQAFSDSASDDKDRSSDATHEEWRKESGSSTQAMASVEMSNQEEQDEDEDEVLYFWPPLVCCFGQALKDFLPTVRVSILQKDPDMYSTWKGLQWNPPEFSRAPGGPAYNVAIALARLGGRVAFMGKVGDDIHGRELVHTLNINRVQTRGVKFDPKCRTGVAQMHLSSENGDLRMSCLQPSAEDCLLDSEINVDILKEARMLHFNSAILTVEPIRSSLLTAIGLSKKYGGVIFFDINLPLPLWRSREEAWDIIREAWSQSNVIEVTKQELEFLLGEKLKRRKSQYSSTTLKQMRKKRDEYHYTPEEVAHIWHPDLKILFVTDGTLLVHYYTREFHGEVAGVEDVIVAAFTCDRTGSGDALVAGIIRKLSTQPTLYNDREALEKALRFAMCAGAIAQWTIGAVRGLPTESAAQNLTEQVYPPALVQPLK